MRGAWTSRSACLGCAFGEKKTLPSKEEIQAMNLLKSLRCFSLSLLLTWLTETIKIMLPLQDREQIIP